MHDGWGSEANEEGIASREGVGDSRRRSPKGDPCVDAAQSLSGREKVRAPTAAARSNASAFCRDSEQEGSFVHKAARMWGRAEGKRGYRKTSSAQSHLGAAVNVQRSSKDIVCKIRRSREPGRPGVVAVSEREGIRGAPARSGCSGRTHYISVRRSCHGGNPRRRRYDPPSTRSRSGSPRGKAERQTGEGSVPCRETRGDS